MTTSAPAAATPLRRRRGGTRVLLLSLLVLAHFLCSVCHASVAASAFAVAGTPTATVAEAGGTAAAPPAALSHAEEPALERHACAGSDVADQWLAGGKALAGLLLGALVITALWLAPPRPRPWFARLFPGSSLAGTRLLVTLCVQRV
ncbi:hypothetical protein [Marinitenerispora sediminis]|uniref:Copper resistance protein CopC n=1 Tax=Marinitenerispora sediminis TaxID=1931232 RepID=A0A368T2R3_9ACTN|nr:hypothetical protein [Marinitenerispora sediminis]RCV49028.1 hypothetical protein DEF28_21905 [Marinitenerispora sediminis]RCV51791.1 hypothetical protein DEF23_19795 [Marinitenerispora sediminis]RCV55409.1 hypothetical protein DEF24_17900 [Marinitenerispora sediminis]